MAQHNDLGKEGEKLALDYLLAQGYQILEKNYTCLKAEVDVIALKENTLIAVEVKTRSSDYFGDPQDFIHPKKIKRLLLAIDQYVLEKDLDVTVRFDVIAIVKQKKAFQIEHLKDAFLYF